MVIAIIIMIILYIICGTECIFKYHNILIYSFGILLVGMLYAILRKRNYYKNGKWLVDTVYI